ncbi:Imm21 family immunity protein [Streptomyces chartreusis]|uniref:Imm21 family immunity protein n=1 Tax=Streptomyces chartreusis TaxID=1969 RepID=UPI0038060662
MSASSSTAADASHASPVWVESMGGPLIVIPVSALAAWRGCTESGVMAGDATAADDYDRACAVDDLAGVITVGENGAQALVPQRIQGERREVPRGGPPSGRSGRTTGHSRRWRPRLRWLRPRRSSAAEPGGGRCPRGRIL